MCFILDIKIEAIYIYITYNFKISICNNLFEFDIISNHDILKKIYTLYDFIFIIVHVHLNPIWWTFIVLFLILTTIKQLLVVNWI